jgi:hypothetical protein
MWRSDRLRLRAGALALGFATLLGGCSDIYYDRRETVTFHAGDAVASNKVVQMIDPWPRAAANRNIEYHGERMQRAADRYRKNKTTPLVSTTTSSAGFTPNKED